MVRAVSFFFPPLALAAGERRLVDDSEPAADTEKLQSVFRFQLFYERRDLVDCRREWRCIGDLRSDMHLHSDQIDPGHFRGALINSGGVLESNTELVLVGAG